MHEGKYLGKQVDYPQQYAPEMLLAVPRHINREQYDLVADKLPFIGYDIWHAYELSFLTNQGLPVTGLLKVVYPATNPNIVESKSFKLYLNSFNMHRCGNTAKEGLVAVSETIKHDLSRLLETEVQAGFFRKAESNPPNDFSDYLILEENAFVDNLSFNHFTEMPQLLAASQAGGSIKIGSHLLRSNCKITHQPDWGSVFIHIEGNKLPSRESLLQYLVSIRNENHFHEEICEMIYKRLQDIFRPEALAVTCLYTRRGGIDICPTRASHQSLLPQYLTNPQLLSSKLLRQ